ncbi:MAG TPA: hypothetical protein VGG83_16875 [Trebonia sp.]|jgi:hypothetical protein
MPQGSPAPQIDIPLQFYHYGYGFYIAGRRSMEDVEVSPGTYLRPDMPAAVIFALASEEFLKCLLNRNNTPKTGHDLFYNLYTFLPRADKNGLKNLYKRYPGRDFEADLQLIAKYFPQLRYLHEYNITTWDSYTAGLVADTHCRYCAGLLGTTVLVDELGVS